MIDIADFSLTLTLLMGNTMLRSSKSDIQVPVCRQPDQNLTDIVARDKCLIVYDGSNGCQPS